MIARFATETVMWVGKWPNESEGAVENGAESVKGNVLEAMLSIPDCLANATSRNR